MTPLKQASLLFVMVPTLTFAASVPKTILPDNIITCQPNANCFGKTLYGRNYRVINTPRFTVMVAISREGAYTRADVSIANNTVLPQSLTPEDFRVEVLTPKPKILLYVPPSDLKDLPAAPTPTPTPAAPQPQTSPTPPIASSFLSQQSSISSTSDPAQTPEVEDADLDAKKMALQQAADKAASDHPLEATSLSPSEVTRGRVYFESDKHARLVNIVLPIAGLVFEFPYSMR
jgi:hypothetical protein